MHGEEIYDEITDSDASSRHWPCFDQPPPLPPSREDAQLPSQPPTSNQLSPKKIPMHGIHLTGQALSAQVKSISNNLKPVIGKRDSARRGPMMLSISSPSGATVAEEPARVAVNKATPLADRNRKANGKVKYRLRTLPPVQGSPPPKPKRPPLNYSDEEDGEEDYCDVEVLQDSYRYHDEKSCF